ncbi:hypothetical protein PybrP1_005060 [[Pythium] brassicae (nom. inval.)]|nr:hypothetical protein PybrP1_005060 [[Pythium] brassicae (nom. inval.)]
MVFFWAGEVTETKAAVVKVPEGFVLNVCNATLASSAAADASAPVVSLGLETTQMDKKPWKGVVAHLGAGAHQVKLDLVFGAAPQVKFYVAKGTGKVNLTGYFQPGPLAELPEAEPVVAAAVATKSPATGSSNNKKRAREEPVTWDQTPSDSDDAKPAAKAPAPQQQKQQKKQEKKPDQQQQDKEDKKPDQQKQEKKPKQDKKQEAPVANGDSGASESGSSKKKHRKKKNKAASADI